MKSLTFTTILALSSFAIASAYNNCLTFSELESKLPYFTLKANILESAGAAENALNGVSVEIYNATTKKTVLNETLSSYSFDILLEKGNNYTILLSKAGYFTKRLDATVGIRGCVLCFESLGENIPGKIEAKNDNSEAGLLNAVILMRRIDPEKLYTVENIFFDYQSSKIRSQDKVVLLQLGQMLKDNPHIDAEIGVHTDSRESKALSQLRAEAIVEFLTVAGIKSNRLSAQGYGNDQRVSNCQKCTEEELQKDRRVTYRVAHTKQIIKNEPFVIKGDANLAANHPKDAYRFGAFGEEVAATTPAAVSPTPLLLGAAAPPASPAAVPVSKADDEVAFQVAFSEHQKICTDYEDAKETTPDVKMADISDHKAPNSTVSSSVISEKPFKNTRARIISPTFTGYKLEILNSAEEIENNHPIFTEVGGIFQEKTQAGYAYSIGEFLDERAAENFFYLIMQERFPNGKIIRYKKGKRAE